MATAATVDEPAVALAISPEVAVPVVSPVDMMNTETADAPAVALAASPTAAAVDGANPETERPQGNGQEQS